MKSESSCATTGCADLSENAIRDYAFHLYEQGGRAQGHDIDNWLEATACLKANIPAQNSHSRLHLHAATPHSTASTR